MERRAHGGIVETHLALFEGNKPSQYRSAWRPGTPKTARKVLQLDKGRAKKPGRTKLRTTRIQGDDTLRSGGVMPVVAYHVLFSPWRLRKTGKVLLPSPLVEANGLGRLRIADQRDTLPQDVQHPGRPQHTVVIDLDGKIDAIERHERLTVA
jgi:hypothetical protein